MLNVRILGLEPGLHPFAFAPTPDELGLAADDESATPPFHDLDVSGTLDIAETQVVASFVARGVATRLCDRTLVPFEQPVEGRYLVVFTPDPTLAADPDADDVVLVAHDAPFVDLAPAVRDTLLLALPTRAVAPGADDADLPMQFGAPDADPRWDALRHLRDTLGDA